MAKRTKAKTRAKDVATLTHDEAKRRNIPTAEYQSLLAQEEKSPIQVAYERRNRDLDPQLVWRGKDMQDWSELVVPAPPLFIQEKVHPKVLIDDLMRRSARRREEAEREETGVQTDLFADFNGLAEDAAKTEFYQHDANWSNRMILGDSLQVMASLAEREGLRGKVQCIYIDPPYGIKFNSNFQWSTTSRDVQDGKVEHITREPEQVKAFRDTWRDGIHSYLTYLRDRLTVARELLSASGSLFLQIGDENVHKARLLLDEILGSENYVAQIFFKTTSHLGGETLGRSGDFVLWYARGLREIKLRPLFVKSGLEEDVGRRYTRVQEPRLLRRPMSHEERQGDFDKDRPLRIYRHDNLKSQSGSSSTDYSYCYEGITFRRNRGFWKTSREGMGRLAKAWRLGYPTKDSLAYVRFHR